MGTEATQNTDSAAAATGGTPGAAAAGAQDETSLLNPDTTQQTPEQKAAADAAAAAKTPEQIAAESAAAEAALTPEQKAAKAAEAAKVAPAKYEPFTMPEGVQLDAEVTGEFETVARELNLPQDKAQKVADVGAKLAQKWQTQQTEAIQKVHSDWKAESLADPEFGGEKVKENMAIAEKGLALVATPELRKLLKETGLGLNKEMIRAFYRVGKMITPDGFVAGDANKGTAKTLEERANRDLYGIGK